MAGRRDRPPHYAQTPKQRPAHSPHSGIHHKPRSAHMGRKEMNASKNQPEDSFLKSIPNQRTALSSILVIPDGMHDWTTKQNDWTHQPSIGRQQLPNR